MQPAGPAGRKQANTGKMPVLLLRYLSAANSVRPTDPRPSCSRTSGIPVKQVTQPKFPMKRIIIITLLTLTAIPFSVAQTEFKGPNIIIIFTDDHGWTDLGIVGVRDDVKTPHTDRLARMGTLFTSGYVTAPQCRPSRAGLMSGRYQNRFGLEHNGHNGYPWSEYTIAERLRDAG